MGEEEYMAKVRVFNQVSVDGFFCDVQGDVNWAHKFDPEWMDFVASNASGNGVLLFGRKTFQMMEAAWTSPMAAKMNPALAERMTQLPKVVFSRTLETVGWANTTLIRDDLLGAVRELKRLEGPDRVVMGSGSVVAQLTQAGLVDEYQLVLNPIILGRGRTLFEGLEPKRALSLKKSRPFSNGNVVLWYEPVASRG